MQIMDQLHDATLLAIGFDWQARRCTLSFIGGPAKPGRFTLTLPEADELHVTSAAPWGASGSVLAASMAADERFVLTMQSGDTVSLLAPCGMHVTEHPEDP